MTTPHCGSAPSDPTAKSPSPPPAQNAGLPPVLGTTSVIAAAPSPQSGEQTAKASTNSTAKWGRRHREHSLYDRRNRHRLLAKEGIDPQSLVYARITGSVEFMCPVCTKLLTPRTINPRTARVRCRCGLKWDLGLVVSRTPVGLPPFNTIFVDAQSGRTRNLTSAPPGANIIGRVSGVTKWACPACRHNGAAEPTWETCALTCRSCAQTVFVALILYRAKWGHHFTPLDWTPPQNGGAKTVDHQQGSAPKVPRNTAADPARDELG